MSRSNNWSFLNTSVERSFFWSLALTALPVASSFVVSWVIARFAGDTVWGTVSWTMAFATALLIVAKLGLGLGASRLASEYGNQHTGSLRALLSTAAWMRVVITLAVAALTFAFARTIAGWFHSEALLWPIRVSAAIVVCASIYEFQEHFLVGLNRHHTVSQVRSAHLLSRVVLTTIVVTAGLGATAVLTSYVAAWIIGIAIFALLLHRFLPPVSDPLPVPQIRRRLLAISLPLAVSSASVTIYTQMDKLMIGYFDTVEEVGQYAIARAVTEVSLFPAFALVMTLRPALASRFASGEVDTGAALIRGSLRLSLVGGVLFASLFGVLAVPLLTFVYSDTFAYAGELMALFAWVIVLRSMSALVLPALVAAERTRFYAWLTAGTAALNFVLNIVLIPRMHARGAIVATIVSYTVLLLFGLAQVFGIFKVQVGRRAVSLALRTVLAGAIAAAVTWGINARFPAPADWSVVGWALGHVALYSVLVLAFRVVGKRDLSALGRT